MPRVLVILAAFLFIGQNYFTSLQARTTNTTLRLPQTLNTSPYITIPAFPGVKFNMPVAMASPVGETNRLFVAEQAGYISVITNVASPNRTVFLDLTDLVSHETSEAGLLGLALHPGFATNGYLYVFHTTIRNGNQRDCVTRFSTDPSDPNRGLRESETLVLFQPEVNSVNHNAGDLHFGPDGYLYISLGDPWQRMQQLDRFYSGMLRIDVDRKPTSIPPNPGPGVTENYLIPPDNPFIGLTSLNGVPIDPARVRTEFWALGLRNPWRFSFDPLTGDLYCGDVGLWSWEEVNIIRSGQNYGWDFAEGPLITNPLGAHTTPPIYAYPHTDAWHAIIGGCVYRGSQDDQLFGAYLFGDWGTGKIFSLRYENNVVSNVRELCNYPVIISFGTAPSTDDILIGSADGTIRRLVRREAPPETEIPERLSETGAFSNLQELTVEAGFESYEVNVPFWSDNAEKKRWFTVPASKTIDFEAYENWNFPPGTTFIKHFDLETIPGDPASRRKVETRFLVITEDGAYGITYAWDDSQTNAALVPADGAASFINIYENGITRTQKWIYPSRSQCLTCHTRQAGFALGFNTLQLNRDVKCEAASTNQIKLFEKAGYFTSAVTNRNALPALADLSNENYSLEFRARSYLAANCMYCHQPLGVSYGNWDARINTPLSQTGLLDGGLNDPLVKLILQGNPTHSPLLDRLKGNGVLRMPPIGTSVLDQNGINLIASWITSLTNRQSYSAWKGIYLKNREPSAESADYDGDGASNYLEYLAKTDPANPQSVWKLQVERTPDFLSLAFDHLKDRIYQLYWTTNLNSEWQLLDDPSNSPIPKSSDGKTLIPLNAETYQTGFFKVQIKEQ